MRTKPTFRWTTTLAVGVAFSGLPLFLVSCNKEESKVKTESTKVVETPEGSKKVTEKRETKTTTEKK